MSWTDAKACWNFEDQGAARAVDVARYQKNIHDMTSGRDQQKKEQQLRAELRESQHLDEEIKDDRVDRWSEFDDEFIPDKTLFVALPPPSEMRLPVPPQNDALSSWSYNGLFSLMKHKIVSITEPPSVNPFTTDSTASPSGPSSRPFMDALQTNLKQQKQDYHHQQAVPDGGGNKTRSTMTLEEIADKFTLNVEQRLAFFTVGESFLRNLNVPEETQTNQLGLYIGGPGGTGKSRVIDAIRYLFASNSKSDTLTICAYTGSAACNANGVTFSSFLAETRPTAKQTKKKDKGNQCLTVEMSRLSTLQNKVGHTRYLVIDEVSMIAAHELAKLDARLRQGKSVNKNLPFGGVNLVFLGDFVQYPPVGGVSLCKTLEIETTHSKDRPPSVHSITGRTLWLKAVTKTVMLHQQMRQDDDSAFVSILTDLRNAEYDQMDQHIDTLQEMDQQGF